MNKKLVIFLIFVLFFTTNTFAERRTRVDRYGYATVKIIWDDTLSGGPDDSNWAQDLYEDAKGWSSILMYCYIIDIEKNTGIQRCDMTLYSDDVYKEYAVTSHWLRDGLWEKMFNCRYRNYNSARMDFDEMCRSTEQLLSTSANLADLIK